MFHVERKKLILIMVICNIILVSFLCLNSDKYQDRAITTATQSSGSEDQYKQLLVNTYLARIIRASDQFYDEYYISSPMVNYYSTFLKKILEDKDHRTYHVIFLSSPYIGPHDTIGIDEITFTADYLGNVNLEKFHHLKSYHLPDNLKSLERKQFPTKYYE